MSHIKNLPFQLSASTLTGDWVLEDGDQVPPYVSWIPLSTDDSPFWETRQRKDGSYYLRELTEEEVTEQTEAMTREIEDPWELLQEFTAIKTVKALLDFLNETGEFCDPYEDPELGTLGAMLKTPESLANEGHLSYAVTDFWEVQELLAEMLLSRRPIVSINPTALPGAWLAVVRGGFHMRITKAFGGYVSKIRTHGTLSSMVTIAQLKIMNGSKFRVCKRPDCGRLFEFETRGRRENRFCSHLCSHTNWQRKARKTRVVVEDERKRFGYGYYRKNK